MDLSSYVRQQKILMASQELSLYMLTAFLAKIRLETTAYAHWTSLQWNVKMFASHDITKVKGFSQLQCIKGYVASGLNIHFEFYPGFTQ